MSTNESPEQPHVVVLHSTRPIATDPAELYPDHRITVLTDGPPGAVVEDLTPPDTVSMPRQEWHDQLVRWSRNGPVEVVTFDESCQSVRDELRAALAQETHAPPSARP